MTLPDNGGPAFPCDVAYRGGAGGLSVRDYFAGQALPAVIANPPLSMHQTATREEIACSAYKLADAMLAARSPAPDGDKPDPRDGLLREICIAAEIVLDCLHERIQEAPDHAVPVFDGFVMLGAALAKAQERLGHD